MSHFSTNWYTLGLQLQNVFTIARSSRSEVPNVFLTIEKDGITGHGESSPNSRYNETPELVEEFFRAFPFQRLNEVETLEQLEIVVGMASKDASVKIGKAIPESAKTAIEMAWLDWSGKSQNKPLWELWGAKSPIGPLTSFTIGIDTIEVMQRKVKEAEKYPLYKIKLGTDHDREIIEGLRAVTDKPLRVDANEGWKTVDQAKREIEFLEKQGIEMVEQPMPSSQIKELKELKKWSPLPLMADESFTGTEPLDEIAEQFDILNIKLMKIGSLVKARRTIQEAQQMGMEVMIGCMIESSLANAAGALLALDCKHSDLDGHVLIKNNPYTGLSILEDGRISLSDQPGFGVTKVS